MLYFQSLKKKHSYVFHNLFHNFFFLPLKMKFLINHNILEKRRVANKIVILKQNVVFQI